MTNFFFPQVQADSFNVLDLLVKLATISIAGFNLYFAYKVFNFKNKKDDFDKENDRKISLLKTLFLDHSFKVFYESIDQIVNLLERLKHPELTDENKGQIDEEVGDVFIKLRRNFYDSLLGIDESLYENIKKKCDELQTHITNTIFDRGVNLSHNPKFDELISDKLLSTKAQIIKTLFSYRG